MGYFRCICASTCLLIAAWDTQARSGAPAYAARRVDAQPAHVVPAPPMVGGRQSSGLPDSGALHAAGIQRLPSLPAAPDETPDATPAKMVDTLEQAWNVALTIDEKLRATRQSASAAEAAWLAAKSERWPASWLESAYTVRDNNIATLIESPLLPFPTPIVQRENFTFESRISLPLYTGGRITNNIDAAAAKVSVGRWEVTENMLNLKMRVAEDYVAVLRAEHELSVARSHVRSLEAHTHNVETLSLHGRAAKNDLLESRVALADGRYQAIRAAYELAARQAAYNRRLGRPLDATVCLAPLELAPELPDPDALTQLALERRPEIARIREQANSLRHQAHSLAAQDRVQVHLQGAYAFAENRYRQPEGIASAGVSVLWKAFDGHRTRWQADSLCKRAAAAAHTQRHFRSLVQLEVRQAWLAVKETRERLVVTRDAIARADENMRVARQRYSTGVASNTVVLDGEYLRVRTYRNHNDAVYDAVLASLVLRRATGVL